MGSQVSTESDFYEGPTNQEVNNSEYKLIPVTQKADSFVDHLREKTDEAIIKIKIDKQKLINGLFETNLEIQKYSSKNMFQYIRAQLLKAALDGKAYHTVEMNFNKYGPLNNPTKDLLAYDNISDFFHKVDDNNSLDQETKKSILISVLFRELSPILKNFANQSNFNYCEKDISVVPFCDIRLHKAAQGFVSFHFVWKKCVN